MYFFSKLSGNKVGSFYLFTLTKLQRYARQGVYLGLGSCHLPPSLGCQGQSGSGIIRAGLRRASLVVQLVKESTCNAGDLGLLPGLGRSPGEGSGYQLQYSGLENSMDCVVQEVTRSQTRVSDFFHFHCSSCGISGTWDC